MAEKACHCYHQGIRLLPSVEAGYLDMNRARELQFRGSEHGTGDLICPLLEQASELREHSLKKGAS